MVKHYTAALQPERQVIVWLCLRYKHRWLSKRAAPHVLHVTMRACAVCAQYVHTFNAGCPQTCVLLSFFMSLQAGVSPLSTHKKTSPFSPPVFASWSKPLQCHCSFWCCGTIGPVEVLISSSIQLHKGQTHPSPCTRLVGRGRRDWPLQDPASSLPLAQYGFKKKKKTTTHFSWYEIKLKNVPPKWQFYHQQPWLAQPSASK